VRHLEPDDAPVVRGPQVCTRIGVEIPQANLAVPAAARREKPAVWPNVEVRDTLGSAEISWRLGEVLCVPNPGAPDTADREPLPV
jgi:hypothetical protein